VDDEATPYDARLTGRNPEKLGLEAKFSNSACIGSQGNEISDVMGMITMSTMCCARRVEVTAGCHTVVSAICCFMDVEAVFSGWSEPCYASADKDNVATFD
jgi:hypothetical protein